MANEDLIKDVFGGSDSDSDSEGGDAGTKADAPERGAALEDSGDDAPADAKGEDGAPDARQPKFRSSLEDPEQADGDSDDDEDERANAPAVAPPMTIEKALHDPLADGVVPKLVKLTNIAGVESRPFDAATFEPTEDHHAKNHNVIRWRRNKDTGAVESNARFVKWSDGTTQLVVGDETGPASHVVDEGLAETLLRQVASTHRASDGHKIRIAQHAIGIIMVHDGGAPNGDEVDVGFEHLTHLCRGLDFTCDRQLD